MDNTKVSKPREANLELLRIVAMLMIITLHYLGKSNSLIEYKDISSSEAPLVNIIIAWFLEAFSYGATNIYVLISGYFCVNTSFRMAKGIKLWLQVFFYSAGIALIFLLCGGIPAEYSGIYNLSKFFLPVASNHYWFASVYLLFMMIAPFLGMIARKLDRKRLLTLIVVLLILFSRFWRDILPFTEPVEDSGIGLAWFITLFFIAAYIRLYVPEIKHKSVPLSIFLASSVLVPASFFAIGALSDITGRFENFTKIAYAYNSVLVTVASVTLFLFFRSVKIKEGFISKAICRIAGLTFGIYLIHEHLLMRNLWIDLWHADKFFKGNLFIPHLIGTVLAVFIICGAIEFLRSFIFEKIYKIRPVEKLFEKVSKIDSFFPDK